MTRLAKSVDHVGSHYDIVVVGSGYGGGVSASRMARAGKRVAVLERGREFLTGEFPNRFPELKNQMRISGNTMGSGPADGLFDVRVGDDMHVLVGCGLGGGSLVNAGVALQPDDRVFEDAAWPEEFRSDGLLAEGYERARAWLRPNSHAAASRLTKYQALESATNGTGGTIVKPPVVVSFEENENPAGVRQPACTLCGDCCSGCNVGAKNTVALTYLPDAVRHGAELFTHAGVKYVCRDVERGVWRILIERTAGDGAKGGGAPIEVMADVVILAAGTLGSTEILLRSAQMGLSTSSRLGHKFSANGDIIAFGYGADKDINAVGIGHPAKLDNFEVGTAVSGQIEVDDESCLENELRIQDGVLPSAIAPILPVMFIPNGRLLGALKSLINGVYKGPFAKLQTFFAVSHDSASGVFYLKKDRLFLSWPNAKNEPVYGRLDAALETVVSNSGGSYVKNPLAGTVMGHQPATAHPLGGCGMGDDANSGVVNHKGQVFNGEGGVHSGLHVVDGAVIPRSLGVNPLLTITAISERAMIHLANELGVSFDCAPVATSASTTPFQMDVAGTCTNDEMAQSDS